MTKPKVVIITQARMTSTRLPGKILKEVDGKPLLQVHLERLLLSKANGVVVATTVNAADDAVVELAKKLKVECFRGSESDVLERFAKAAERFEADVVVRVTSDCPLIDPELVDELISFFSNGAYDYASNIMTRRYPRGMDAEIFTRQALDEANEQAKSPLEREHVTPFFYNHPERYRLGSLVGRDDLSSYRLTVDTPEDFELIKRILPALGGRKTSASLKEIVTLLKNHPDWAELNQRREEQHLAQERHLRTGSKR